MISSSLWLLSSAAMLEIVLLDRCTFLTIQTLHFKTLYALLMLMHWVVVCFFKSVVVVSVVFLLENNCCSISSSESGEKDLRRHQSYSCWLLKRQKIKASNMEWEMHGSRQFFISIALFSIHFLYSISFQFSFFRVFFFCVWNLSFNTGGWRSLFANTVRWR